MSRILFTVLFVAASASQVATAYDTENIRVFLKKKETCAFAVYRVMRGKLARESFPQRFDVTCIGDIKVGQGIREKSGCGAFNYNVETEKMTNLTAFGPNIAEGKPCGAGGFEAVLDQLLYTDNSESPSRKVLVRDFLAPMPEGSEPASFFRMVVHSDSEAYRTKLGYPIKDVDLKTIDVTPMAKKNQRKVERSRSSGPESELMPSPPIGISTRGRGR